jgi:HK97 family phage major capsid protein
MDMLEIKTALDKITDQTKEVGEKALAEAKKGVQLAEGQKQQIDELLTKQTELRAALTEVQQKQARASVEEKRFTTAGEKFVNSAEYKAFQEAGGEHKRGEMLRVNVKAITSLPGSVGAAVTPDIQTGVLALPQRRLMVRDLLAPGRTDKTLIQYFKESGFTNAAAPVAENTKKPESAFTLTAADAKVIKLAHFMKATTEILDDLPALQSMIDERLRYGLAFVEEAQLLNGSGVGNNLNGIYTQATAFAAPTGTTTTGASRIDILRLAFLQAELALFPATAAVLHPTDWALIEMQKDTQGRYIIGNPQGSINPTLWGRQLVTSLAMAQDTFLAGAFRQAAQIFDREDANVVVATENEDDFVNNRVTILAEERLALAVYRPESLIKGDLTPA